ncbi:hypothetical protein [Vibrio spartinae]|uniref:Uncharacterized protein n=1 Tax=Vibrio spartinae TaxID=1918945 RepID=A0A1N6M5V2_9VIBR|nr:hypothetical protein [Vibrio spartinae]SIO94821.1 hypothetical protein VSP9026_02551 [Vibrio spartinae]
MQSLSAQIVINLSLNVEHGCVDYIVTTHEGECHGINQLAEKLRNSVMKELPEHTPNNKAEAL